MLLKLSCTKNVSLASGLAVMAMGLMLGTPAVAGEIYSWQTESGEFAFADDPKKIPARYRDQVSSRPASRLDDYERFTSGDAKATSSYEDQLALRLERLRRLNAQSQPAPSDEGLAVGIASVRIQGMDLRLPGAVSELPLIVEQKRVISAGQVVSRHDTVVRQGNRTLAIIRGGNAGEVSSAEEIYGEADLETYE